MDQVLKVRFVRFFQLFKPDDSSPSRHVTLPSAERNIRLGLVSVDTGHVSAEYFPSAPPARATFGQCSLLYSMIRTAARESSCTAVAGLPRNALVEIEAVTAILPTARL